LLGKLGRRIRTKTKIEFKMKKFTNAKDALNYLKNEAKEGETIILDERATAIRPRRINYFKKLKQKLRIK